MIEGIITIINCDTYGGTSKTNSTESAECINPSQGVNVR